MKLAISIALVVLTVSPTLAANGAVEKQNRRLDQYWESIKQALYEHFNGGCVEGAASGISIIDCLGQTAAGYQSAVSQAVGVDEIAQVTTVCSDANTANPKCSSINYNFAEKPVKQTKILLQGPAGQDQIDHPQIKQDVRTFYTDGQAGACYEVGSSVLEALLCSHSGQASIYVAAGGTTPFPHSLHTCKKNGNCVETEYVDEADDIQATTNNLFFNGTRRVLRDASSNGDSDLPRKHRKLQNNFLVSITDAHIEHFGADNCQNWTIGDVNVVSCSGQVTLGTGTEFQQSIVQSAYADEVGGPFPMVQTTCTGQSPPSCGSIDFNFFEKPVRVTKNLLAGPSTTEQVDHNNILPILDSHFAAIGGSCDPSSTAVSGWRFCSGTNEYAIYQSSGESGPFPISLIHCYSDGFCMILQYVNTNNNIQETINVLNGNSTVATPYWDVEDYNEYAYEDEGPLVKSSDPTTSTATTTSAGTGTVPTTSGATSLSVAGVIAMLAPLMFSVMN